MSLLEYIRPRTGVPIALEVEVELMRRGIIEKSRATVLDIHLWMLEWTRAQWLLWGD